MNSNTRTAFFAGNVVRSWPRPISSYSELKSVKGVCRQGLYYRQRRGRDLSTSCPRFRIVTRVTLPHLGINSQPRHRYGALLLCMESKEGNRVRPEPQNPSNITRLPRLTLRGPLISSSAFETHDRVPLGIKAKSQPGAGNPLVHQAVSVRLLTGRAFTYLSSLGRATRSRRRGRISTSSLQIHPYSSPEIHLCRYPLSLHRCINLAHLLRAYRYFRIPQYRALQMCRPKAQSTAWLLVCQDRLLRR